MKALLINGSPHKNGCTNEALLEVAKTFLEEGVESEIFHVGTAPIVGCSGCGGCRRNPEHSCVFGGSVVEISKRIEEFDCIIVGSPVHYAGVSGAVSSFLDRLFYSSSDKLRGKVGACVVSCRRGGASSAFDRINKYFTICGMVVATSQYWNQVHGSTPEEVRRDLEGLQTMRTLAKNASWLIKSINAGKEAGIKLPVLEPRVHTSFIR